MQTYIRTDKAHRFRTREKETIEGKSVWVVLDGTTTTLPAK